jgi:hypothetical protein
MTSTNNQAAHYAVFSILTHLAVAGQDADVLARLQSQMCLNVLLIL